MEYEEYDPEQGEYVRTPFDEADYAVQYLNGDDEECDPMEDGYYTVRIVGQGQWRDCASTWFRIIDKLDVKNLWDISFDSRYVDRVEGQLVWPEFTVLDSEDSPVDPDSYEVAVMRYADGYGSELVEVKAGEQRAGEYFLRVTPTEASGYHGYLQDRHEWYFYVYDEYDLGEYEVNFDKSYFNWDMWGYKFLSGEYPSEFAPIVGDDEDDLLEAGVHYTLAYQVCTDESDEDNDNNWRAANGFDGVTPGLYRFKITGKAPYHSVTYSDTFRIVALNDLCNAYVEGLDDRFIERTDSVSPQLTVELADAALVEGRDYTVTYYNAVWDPEYGYEIGEKVSAPLGVGVYWGFVEGVGSYTGLYSDYFELKDAHSLAAATFELNRTVYPCTEKPVVLDYTICAYDGSALTLGKDYRLKYGLYGDEAIYDVSDEVPVECLRHWYDSYAVYAEGIGAYTGETRCRLFKIVESGSLEAAIVRFNGSQISYGDSVAYANNTNAGTATVTVTGKGSYEGSVEAAFTIAKTANSVKVAKSKVAKTFKAKKLKKKARAIALPRATADFGKATWSVAAKDKKRVLSLKNGKVQVKKGARKGTYTIKLKANVAESSNYRAAPRAS